MRPTNEAEIKNQLIIEQSQDPDTRLFNNPCGVAWTGEVRKRGPGWIILDRPRAVTYGLVPGSSDLIGWKTITITSDMIGERIAVFTAIETKTRKGVASRAQENFIRVVNLAGGFGRVARSATENLELFWKGKK